jgi:hypothetical protein
MSNSDEAGWTWFDTSPTERAARASASDKEASDASVTFARCFATPDGQRVLRHLRRLTLDRAVGPGTSDAHLRHLEGQRHLVLHILALVDHGASHD